jgi:hypothetical protein
VAKARCRSGRPQSSERRCGFPLDTTAVALASGLTVGKYILIGSGMAVTTVLLLRYLITRSFGPGAGSLEPQAG